MDRATWPESSSYRLPVRWLLWRKVAEPHFRLEIPIRRAGHSVMLVDRQVDPLRGPLNELIIYCRPPDPLPILEHLAKSDHGYYLVLSAVTQNQPLKFEIDSFKTSHFWNKKQLLGRARMRDQWSMSNSLKVSDSTELVSTGVRAELYSL
jgi:hypothetical protein